MLNGSNYYGANEPQQIIAVEKKPAQGANQSRHIHKASMLQSGTSYCAIAAGLIQIWSKIRKRIDLSRQMYLTGSTKLEFCLTSLIKFLCCRFDKSARSQTWPRAITHCL